MSTPLLTYQTSVQTDALADGMQRQKWRLPPESQLVQFAAFALDQDYGQRIDQFPPAPKNTPSSSSPFSLNKSNAILTDLTEPQNTGGALGKFTATFQVVPQTWNDVKVTAFAFPGFPGLIGQTGSRDIFTDEVDCRYQYDYYVLDPGNVLGGSPSSGGGVANASSVVDSNGVAVKTVFGMTDIPLIAKTFFVVAFGGTPDYTNRTNSLIVSGGASINGVNWFQTLPTKVHYQTWITNVGSHGWSTLVWDGTTDGAGSGNGFGQLVIKDSQLVPLAGNIIARVTQFVLVK